jgi:hypothetical protein
MIDPRGWPMIHELSRINDAARSVAESVRVTE